MEAATALFPPLLTGHTIRALDAARKPARRSKALTVERNFGGVSAYSPAMHAVFAGEAVAVSESLSRRCRLQPGDTVQLEGPLGMLSARVTAVYADYSRDQGFVLMSQKLFARLRNDARA